MKSAVAALGLVAAANAYTYPRHMHYRRDNGTDSGLTTLTVVTTQVHTITSCAPTVTNCPARDQTSALDELPETDKTVVVVTDTVVLTETVCPVTEAGSISSSVIEQAATGGITGAYTLTAPLTTGPISTGNSSPEATSVEDGSELTTVVSEYVTDKAVTLTIGTGTDAVLTTTTVRSTVQTTITVPCSEVDAENTEGSSNGQGSSAEPTTTTTGTKTSTVTKTIVEADTTATATAGNNSPVEGSSGAEGSSGLPDSTADATCVCGDNTVTVTAAASTVYVTVGGDYTGVGSEGTKTEESTGATETSTSDDDDEDDEDDEDYCEDEDATTTIEATVTVVPYPVNSTFTGGYAAPTGFARLVR
ncbi:hypothetical protein B0J13DRAFT_670386 [Dactylonectria estremocensis]|uniref:Lustrin A n=1 Tax=Dactylonectria estremocensis TaxID=1079267 RepID=A0A9P9FC62_9HYPO|nr:hypothetical protein B0J13DRAFT_670386 [Dactylonectria estremocensis]